MNRLHYIIIMLIPNSNSYHFIKKLALYLFMLSLLIRLHYIMLIPMTTLTTMCFIVKLATHLFLLTLMNGFHLIIIMLIPNSNSNHFIIKLATHLCMLTGGQISIFYVFALISLFHSFPFEPVHKISNNVICATSKALDQPAHTRSLIRAIACHLNIL